MVNSDHLSLGKMSAESVQNFFVYMIDIFTYLMEYFFHNSYCRITSEYNVSRLFLDWRTSVDKFYCNMAFTVCEYARCK